MTDGREQDLEGLPTEPAKPIDAEAEIPFEDEEGPEAAEWHQLPPEREFFATPYDPPVKALVAEIRDKELVVRPTFQRYAVWDATRKSRFIESVLLNIPIPTMFFAEDDDQSKVVVDGQQRLTALREFLDNAFPLKGLEVLAQLNGKRFDDLTDRQRRIVRNRTLRCLLISARSDSEIRFQVFERLNQGGVSLNAQEVRHCVYRGATNDLLHNLAKSPLWLKTLGTSVPNKRMTDCELILRFFAIRDVLPNYTPPLKTLLNNFMRDHRNPDATEIVKQTEAFESALLAVSTAFRVVSFRGFRKVDGNRVAIDGSLNRAVFDAQMLVMEGIDPKWLAENRRKVVTAFADLCVSDEGFADSIRRATADKSRLGSRLRKWAGALSSLGAELPHAARLPKADA